MKHQLLHYLRITAGVFFLLLGVAGMFLPILQGFLFLGIGFMLLIPSMPWAQRLVLRLEKRYRWFRRMIVGMRCRLRHRGVRFRSMRWYQRKRTERHQHQIEQPLHPETKSGPCP